MTLRAPARVRTALAAMALVAGCGSTVQQSSTATLQPGLSGPAQQQSGSPSGQDSTSATTGGTGRLDVPGSGTSAGTGSTVQGTTGGPVSSTAPSSTEAPVAVRGPRSPIEIGVLILANQDQFAGSLGVSAGGAAGNPRAQVLLIVADVNAHGGIGGRQVKPVISEFDANNAAALDSQMQAICTAWTQDHHVSAAINSALYAPMTNLEGCLKNAGVPFLQMREWPTDFTKFPNVVNTAMIDLKAASTLYVDRLQAQGFFGSKPVIGLMRWDSPVTKRASDEALKPALKRYGLAVKEEVAVLSDANFATGIQNAALRFRSSGVDHVLFLAPSGGALFFMTYAESQAWHPKYGVTSYDAPAQLLQGTVPAAQLRNSVGVGWYPVLDVDLAHDPGGNPSATRCLSVYSRGGSAASTRGNQRSSFGFCDGLWALQRAADLRGTLPAQLLAGVHALGTSHRSPYSFATRLTPDRSTGPAAARDLRYDTGCSCFTYLGPLRPVA